MPWENEQRTLEREIMEETGLRVVASRFLLRYDSTQGIPVRLAVFEVEIEGELRGSWEGTPCWVEIGEAGKRILRSQRRIIEEIQKR